MDTCPSRNPPPSEPQVLQIEATLCAQAEVSSNLGLSNIVGLSHNKNGAVGCTAFINNYNLKTRKYIDSYFFFFQLSSLERIGQLHRFLHGKTQWKIIYYHEADLKTYSKTYIFIVKIISLNCVFPSCWKEANTYLLVFSTKLFGILIWQQLKSPFAFYGYIANSNSNISSVSIFNAFND